MATLILTTVGTALGGPIGGAIGAAIGQTADQALFAPRARRGPRLGDLTVQTSSYGSQIPKIFGTVRVAGTVIWSTDLIESRTASGGGKGRPKTVGYSYSASFAVALSARPVRAVRRIWADGKLLRGVAGDLKAGGQFRFHPGDEDQPVDPLIAAAEGGAAPAYRGIAYAVFEQLQLADFGNRVPSLTFEVEADAGHVSIGAIARELTGGAVEAGETPLVRGYAATGDSIRSALTALFEPTSLSLAEVDGRLVAGIPAETPAPLFSDEMAVPIELARRAAGSAPSEVTLSYHDPARDYQAGSQRARLTGPPSRAEAHNVPAVLSAADAKALAEDRLAALRAGRETARVRLPWRRQALRPGCTVRVDGEAARWRVTRWLLEAMAVELELVRLPGARRGSLGAAHGRAVAAPDGVHGPTTLLLLDLPVPIAGDGMGIVALASGTSAAWRRAGLLVSVDGGVNWIDAGATAEPAIIGRSLTALAPGGSALIDAGGSVEVELLNEEQWLESRSDAALAAGQNVAILGRELIQFGDAAPIGGRRFRLSRLLRGRRGTERAAPSHEAGEPFALLAPEAVLALPVPPSAVGAFLVAIAAGIGDPVAGTRAELTVTGEALRPPSPVHLRDRFEANGDLVLEWVRRSRAGWDWMNAADAPLAEENESYVVSVSGGAVSRRFAIAEPRLVYTAAERDADGMMLPLDVTVSQVGTHATSSAARLRIG